MSTSTFKVFSLMFIALMAAGSVYGYRRYKRFLRRCPKCRNERVVRVPQVYSTSAADKPLFNMAQARARSLFNAQTAGALLAAFRELCQEEQCAVYIFRRCPLCQTTQWRSYDSRLSWWRLAYMTRFEPECFEHQPTLFKAAGIADPRTFLGKPHPPIMPLYFPDIRRPR